MEKLIKPLLTACFFILILSGCVEEENIYYVYEDDTVIFPYKKENLKNLMLYSETGDQEAYKKVRLGTIEEDVEVEYLSDINDFWWKIKVLDGERKGEELIIDKNSLYK